MNKVEINGRTYCVETLIYTVERLTKDVKASAEYHRLILEQIKDEIQKLDNKLCQQFLIEDIDKEVHHTYQECLDIIDKYK